MADITCSNPQEVCVEGKETRYIDPDKIPLTLDCWKYETTYECKVDSDNNCKQLVADGCSPAAATCKTTWGGICAVQEVTYDCPIRKCDGQEIVCNDGKGFCLTGICMSATRTDDQDMKGALSALSAVAEASKDYGDGKKNNLFTFFKGETAECSVNITNFKDCCGRASGWGVGILAECAEDEKALVQQKANGVVAEVGTYCHNEVAGVCTSEHTTHCVFKSKLARIVRVAARDQLGKGFGSAEHPKCDGVTPEEFKRLDFSKIDFREFYTDIDAKTKVQLADKVNPKMRAKLDSVKADMEQKAAQNKKIADERLPRT